MSQCGNPTGRVANEQRRKAPRPVLVVVGAVAILSCAGRGAIAVEPENQQWKPLIGEWYRWTDQTGVEWDALDIAASQGKKKATFLSRHGESDGPTEYFRAILFSEGAEVLPLPYNLGDKEIEVWWYDAVAKEGPFLRLSDTSGEYLVDLRRRTTALMFRRKGLTFVGELRPGDDKASLTYSDLGTRLEVSVAGRPAMVVIGPLATGPGKKVGKITER
jgi:hypothetical protein